MLKIYSCGRHSNSKPSLAPEVAHAAPSWNVHGTLDAQLVKRSSKTASHHSKAQGTGSNRKGGYMLEGCERSMQGCWFSKPRAEPCADLASAHIYSSYWRFANGAVVAKGSAPKHAQARKAMLPAVKGSELVYT